MEKKLKIENKIVYEKLEIPLFIFRGNSCALLREMSNIAAETHNKGSGENPTTQNIVLKIP